MADPIAFKPVTVDFKADLERRLAEASEDRAAALLKAYAVLEAANDEGLLDLLHGMISSRDAIVTKLAEYAALPGGVVGIRNLLMAAKILTELDPEVLDHMSRAITSASKEHQLEQKPPSLWQLWKRATSEDGRRGLSFMTLLLTGLGKAAKDS
jgi:uncharacterized protein YjgD (DUF1641 family)